MKKILPLLLVMILWMSCDKIKSIRDADDKEVIEKEIVPENIIEEKKVVKETHEIVITPGAAGRCPAGLIRSQCQ